MSQIKPSSHGIVVDHKETGVRYAVSDRNYNPDVHRKVRDLKPGESVLTFRVKLRQATGSDEPEAPEQAAPATDTK